MKISCHDYYVICICIFFVQTASLVQWTFKNRILNLCLVFYENCIIDDSRLLSKKYYSRFTLHLFYQIPWRPDNISNHKKSQTTRVLLQGTIFFYLIHILGISPSGIKKRLTHNLLIYLFIYFFQGMYKNGE